MIGDVPDYLCYWGKTSDSSLQESRDWHLLAYHCLDVAACGYLIVERNIYCAKNSLYECGLGDDEIPVWIAWLFATHDIGKFARGFQRLVEFTDSPLVPPVNGVNAFARHDSLGMYLWQKLYRGWLAGKNNILPDIPPEERDEYEDALHSWMSVSTGHHGLPPDNSNKKIPLAFCDDDIAAAEHFMEDLSQLFPIKIPAQWKDKNGRKNIRQQSWFFAGLMTLCDWMGSDQTLFPVVSTPMPLPEYWPLACERAQRALSAIPSPSEPNPYSGYQTLFPFIRQLTPLQQRATTLDISSPGPQLIILEDVTGAGKTEAALILAHRLLSAGKGQGLYVGLPGMATANAMYQRLQKAYRQLFSEESQPSLILAHSGREMSEAFRQSIWQPSATDAQPYSASEATASGQCHAWYADSRKKALLAEMGVGTLDQLLMAVMPFRHQSLRLLGMRDKVLLLDEVHAYDSYMVRLLEGLLHFHAAQGGSAIILSATLPASLREKLLAAFNDGAGFPPQTPDEADYPWLSHLSAAGLYEQPLPTRPEVQRTVAVNALVEPSDAMALIHQAVAAGQCICWIRNTVDEALDIYQQLLAAGTLPAADILLFHSRFAFADRLAIEEKTLNWFGKDAPPVSRKGKVLIATQVVEQSLDVDFDWMISDLAPIDLLIQRAGRLQRHIRDAEGNPKSQLPDERQPPVLHLYGPQWQEDAHPEEYAKALKGTGYIYPDHGCLWRTQALLRQVGEIRMPEGARTLVDGVYEQKIAAPAGLQTVSDLAFGQDLSRRSVAAQNLLSRNKGYDREASDFLWSEDREFSTRLGEPSLDVYLAWPDGDGILQPIVREGDFRWEKSRISLRESWWRKHQAQLEQPEEEQLALFRKQQHRPTAQVVLVSEQGEAAYYSKRFGLTG
ncbi:MULTISPECIES: CRISPR-associated helicase Cas3' [Enterobacterales]|uniref:CRISPR-associated helicase Cas3' n=1 Tax=Enterobacterales TaxID=91347 RepID=UPI002EDB9098